MNIDKLEAQRKYRVEQWLDGDWRDIWGFPTREEADDYIKSCEEEGNYLTRITGFDCVGEYRVTKGMSNKEV